MNLKTLQIVRNELLQKKLVSETNIENFLMDEKLESKKRAKKIMKELDKLKDSTLMISFWEEFIESNIIIPEEVDNKKEKIN
jgi:hypothetical protein